MRHEVGLIGVGLMGHGIARNILKHGHQLTVLEHPGNQPLDELLASDVQTRKKGAEVAQSSDVIILCVTGSPEVEAVLTSPGGVLEGLRKGAIIVDCSTAVPASTQRMAQLVDSAGGRFIDAPMTRTAKHAHEGKLNLLVGADPVTLDEVRPILSCFAENIVHSGPVSAGHLMKLLHNYVSLGFVSLLAEASACAVKAEIDPAVFVDVLAMGGGGGAALERLKPFLLAKDASGLQFSISNALKDLTYYNQMSQDVGASNDIALGVKALLSFAMQNARGRTMIPELVDILVEHK